jgi:hypothetical protein
MEILDHLMLALGCANRKWEASFKVVERIVLICGVAVRREAGVLEGPAMITRLPFAVYLMAASWACGEETLLSFLLRVLQMNSGLGQLSAANSRCARSTTKLGLSGLVLATAE